MKNKKYLEIYINHYENDPYSIEGNFSSFNFNIGDILEHRLPLSDKMSNFPKLNNDECFIIKNKVHFIWEEKNIINHQLRLLVKVCKQSNQIGYEN